MIALQQGDQFLIESTMPKGSKALKTMVLAAGSSTGHRHTLKGPGKLYQSGDKLFLKATKQVQIVHPEHKTVKVPAGTYEVRTCREFDHFENEARAVVD